MHDRFAVAAHWNGVFDEAGLQQWAEKLRKQLQSPRVSLGVLFLTPSLFPHAEAVLEIVRVHGRVPLLVGCSSSSLISGNRELEDAQGLVLGLFALPGADLRAFHFGQDQVEEPGGAADWPGITGLGPDQTNGWLVFADPFHLDAETWLRGWNEAYAPLPVLGGLASGRPDEPGTQVYLNGEVFDEGGVALSVGGEVGLKGVILQGCTPIGQTWTITRAERNLIHEIGNRPAYEVLAETFNGLPQEEQAKTRGNLFVGLVVNEYREDFHRGDFLIRNLLGADPRSGTLAVGAFPRPGQTLQFQRRDAEAATEDLDSLLGQARRQLSRTQIYGGCLCSCNGRGSHLFSMPNHDADLIQNRLGPFGLAGFFCNGEIGPVGDRNYLHGYTASLALFVKKAPVGE
jgi:small ligand-binding sensory domain FIST